jgi:hypothetical protein
MDPRWLFPVLSAVFLVLSGCRYLRNGRRLDPAAKTWLTTGLVFAAVWLWLHFHEN